MFLRNRVSAARFAAPLIVAGLLSACVESQPTAPELAETTRPLQRLECQASRTALTVRCTTDLITPEGANADIIGGQGTNVKLTSSNVAYNSGTEIFSFDVTIQNLMNEAIGTPDGVIADTSGIRVFFHSGPTVTGGTGLITVANADGTDTFTGAGQPYFRYNEILAKDQVSAAKTWQLTIPASVTNFAFTVYVSTEIQPLLVINEVLANPGGLITDANGEWFEIYNAGSRQVDLQNLVIADSAASGRRPYHLIISSVVIPAGGYATLGNTTNTTDNGGVSIDYAYGPFLTLANSLDAVKIARVYGMDTLTIDRTQYSSAGVSAQNGISRELRNPALDNSNMDGSNWGDASVTSVYGPGGRGTPKAQNSQFAPRPMRAPGQIIR